MKGGKRKKLTMKAKQSGKPNYKTKKSEIKVKQEGKIQLRGYEI